MLSSTIHLNRGALPGTFARGRPGEVGAVDCAVGADSAWSTLEKPGAAGDGYEWWILTNHPFAEGNKRTALAAMVTHLEINGFTWNCSEVEETAMVLRAAAGDEGKRGGSGW